MQSIKPVWTRLFGDMQKVIPPPQVRIAGELPSTRPCYWSAPSSQSQLEKSKWAVRTTEIPLHSLVFSETLPGYSDSAEHNHALC